MRDHQFPRIAVVGCGYWGKNLVRNLFQLECLGLVCDDTASGRATAAEVAPGVPVTEEVEAVLASDVSGVVIATPAETHYELARRALEAGKDVFVEKPLALTYEQGTGWSGSPSSTVPSSRSATSWSITQPSCG